MILFLGENKMIIKNFLIRKLHGYYNYNISLNDDISFIYGPNGCGKTTILNIISSIITGKLYNLFDYNFSTIELLYYHSDDIFNEEIIKIKKDNNLFIVFKNEEYEVQPYKELDDRYLSPMDIADNEVKFFKLNPVASQISSTFNYVYLPLNRSCMDNYSDNDLYFRRRNYYPTYLSGVDNRYNNYLNDSLNYIADIIRDSCARISSSENQINAQFHREVLTSSVYITSNLELGKLFSELDNTSWDDIMQKKIAYIKTLKEVGDWNQTLEKQIEVFFNEFKKAFDSYKNIQLNDAKSRIELDLIFKYTEFIKIRKIADLAKKMEEKKEKVRRPKLDFLNIINSFFTSSGNDKIMEINNEGKVLFKQPNYKNKKTLTLNNLSSGEKQLVIIFASLVFGLKNGKRGIYIVDEPEASLHLAWQNKFVKSVLSLNNNIQLIFATHSPEIIGKYRDKTVKLIRYDEGI